MSSASTSNTLPAPLIAGIQLFTAQAGIKYEGRDDITLFLLDENATIGAVFTQNRFCAAPVRIAQDCLATNANIRALVINTGSANAGTGAQGLADALRVCDAVAAEVGCEKSAVLPFSTGVILEPLPADKIISALKNKLPATWETAARAIMTTDMRAKIAHKTLNIQGHSVILSGIAKGAGMIHPNMATMLAFIATDATVPRELLQQWTLNAAHQSFNAITVDGDTSTNDSFITIATGKSSLPQITENSEAAAQLQAALNAISLDLALQIVRDGEGATKFLHVHVQGAKSVAEARQVAYAIAKSPLVKTAFYASDPNLGRILCAIGYSGATFNFQAVKLWLNDVLVAENGGRAASYTEEAGQKVMQNQDIKVTVDLQQGEVASDVYSCDFSHDYVSINADYRN